MIFAFVILHNPFKSSSFIEETHSYLETVYMYVPNVCVSELKGISSECYWCYWLISPISVNILLKYNIEKIAHI